MPKSTFSANAYLNAQYRNTPYSPPATVYVALYTAAPGIGGGGTEVTGGSYLRQAVTFGAPSGQVLTNSLDVVFPTATAGWGTLVAYGYFDAVSGGNLISFNNLGASRVISTGDVMRLPAGQLTITEA